MFWSFYPLAYETDDKHLSKPFFKVIRKSLYEPLHSVFHLISRYLEVGHIRLGSALLCNLYLLSVLILNETFCHKFLIYYWYFNNRSSSAGSIRKSITKVKLQKKNPWGVSLLYWSIYCSEGFVFVRNETVFPLSFFLVPYYLVYPILANYGHMNQKLQFLITLLGFS